jgi:hypothetical protein
MVILIFCTKLPNARHQRRAQTMIDKKLRDCASAACRCWAARERSYEEADINCGDYFIPREKRRCDGDKEIGPSAHANEYEDDHKEHN